MKDFIKENKKLIDIILCIFIIISMYLVPSTINSYLSLIIKNSTLSALLSNTLYIVILFLIFKCELISEFKTFKSDIKGNITNGFKWYFLGIMLMIAFNLILTNVLGGISDNEKAVRGIMTNAPIYAFISVSIIAPVVEELVFRKSIMRTTKNKWLGSTICAIAFGLIHVIDYIFDSPLSILYILPYASLGFVFASMDYESKNTYTSIMYHSFHNTFTFFLITFLTAWSI